RERKHRGGRDEQVPVFALPPDHVLGVQLAGPGQVLQLLQADGAADVQLVFVVPALGHGSDPFCPVTTPAAVRRRGEERRAGYSASCHRRMTLSSPPEAARRSFGEKSTQWRMSVCPSRRHTSLPVSASQK